MQPYFLPYIGYYQLISAVDRFIVYDNIKYTKKGWINRNRIMANGVATTFSLPLRKDSDHLDVVERELADSFDRRKLLNQFRGAYGGAPYVEEVMPLLERILQFPDANLFRYIEHSLRTMCNFLGLGTEITVSSNVDCDHDLKGQERVLAICSAVGASAYINAIGGKELYSRDVFRSHGVELQFIRSKPIEYPQSGSAFVPWLSIVDLLMFCPLATVQNYINTEYEAI
jgi:hypothetical protein